MGRLTLMDIFTEKLERKVSSQKVDSESDTAEDFVHQPLDLETKTIRVLRILPGRSGSVIRCELTHHPLRNDHVCLSYAWGDEHDPKTILVNGKNLTIRRNLYNFLYHARKHRVRYWLWVDAICINQNDTREKSHQVRQMGQIYQQARFVLIWTGASLSWDQLMAHFMNHSMYRLLTGVRFIIKETRPWWGIRWCPLLSDGFLIIRSTYWRRMWIVQEVLLARHAYVFVGSRKLSVAGLLDIALAARNTDNMHDGEGCVDFAQHNYLRIDTLDRLLFYFGDQECTDRRDKVYSLLGLLDQIDAFRVDYTEDVITVFMRATQSIWAVDAGAEISTIKMEYCASLVARSLELRSVMFCKHYLRYRRVRLRKLGHASTAPTPGSQAMLEILMVVFDVELNSSIFKAAWGEIREEFGWERMFCCYWCRDRISSMEENACARFVARHGYCHLWIQVTELPLAERKDRPKELSVLDEVCTGPRDPSDVQDEELYLRLLDPPKGWKEELAKQMRQEDSKSSQPTPIAPEC